MGVSDIETGIWTCGVRSPDPSSNVQMPREQACLRSVPLESPGDGNRNRCDREGPRGGRLGEDMEERMEGKADGQKQRNVFCCGLGETRASSAPPCRSSLNASASRTNTNRMLLRPIGGPRPRGGSGERGFAVRGGRRGRIA